MENNVKTKGNTLQNKAEKNTASTTRTRVRESHRRKIERKLKAIAETEGTTRKGAESTSRKRTRVRKRGKGSGRRGKKMGIIFLA